MNTHTLTGTGSSLRLVWRRNRIFWTCWIIGLAIMMPMTTSQYDTIIPPGSDPRATIEPLRANPSMLALLGPAFDVYTKGGFVFWRVGGFTSCFAGMMAGFGVIRATRAEEEAGRHELLRSGAIGRHAPLAAALLLGALGSLALGVVSAVLVVATGLPVAGSIAAGLAFTLVGLVFTGIGAVVSQVFASARVARYWTPGFFFGGMFLARMMVDARTDVDWARWAIPMEWGMLMRPYSGERWWVFGLGVVLFAVLAAGAFALESRRDHGAGLLADKPGRDRAAASLSGAWGLAWRLQRGALLGWTLAIVCSAYGCGSIIGQMQSSIDANPQVGKMLEKLGGSSNVEVGFYVGMLGILGTVAAIFAAVVLNRLRSEEASGHSEMLLATAASRTSQALSHLVPALVVPSLAFVLVGACLPMAPAFSSGDWSDVARYTRSALALLPGLWLVVGLAMALIGWLPRWTGLVWAVLGWTMFATWFAVLFDLPQWLLTVQPWGHLPHLPRDPMDWTPVVVESLLAAALVILGLVGYRRRGIPS